MTDTPIILLGGGGHARVLVDALLETGAPVLGYAAPAPGDLPDLPWLGDDAAVLTRPPGSVRLVNGLGTVGDARPRRALFQGFRKRGYRFAEVIHPNALLSRRAVSLGEGVQILAGAVVATGSRLGDDVLVNTRAVVEHDCEVGAHTHVATGAVLCGGCRIGTGVHVGAGATLIQGIRVGDGAVIAAGAVVIADVEPLTLAAGVPARCKKRLNP